MLKTVHNVECSLHSFLIVDAMQYDFWFLVQLITQILSVFFCLTNDFVLPKVSDPHT